MQKGAWQRFNDIMFETSLIQLEEFKWKSIQSTPFQPTVLHFWPFPVNWPQPGCLSPTSQCAHSAGSAPLRSLPVTEPWTSLSAAWLNKPHTVISKPCNCGVDLDTLLYMCLHITSIHSMARLWFATWLASMSVLCLSTDQIASLMAWDDDTGWNFFRCSSKTTS